MRQNNLLSLITDLTRQISRYIPISLEILERHNRGYEELDSLHLSLEELRELLSDYFSESSRNADKISERLSRLERLAILEKTSSNPTETQQIKAEISKDLRLSSLRTALVQEVQNLTHTLEKRAHYGIDVPVKILNEIQLYTERIDALKEQIDNETSIPKNQFNLES